ncbi:MAG TPA: hypothetical protein VFK14_11800 [Solirubrobacterales bacterium]|nr:hypothetical protein [Solirubrobacterales bacterium]
MGRTLAGALAVVACLGAFAAPAEANRALLSEALLKVEGPSGPPQGQIEGACGLAVTASNQLYVSDYYHRVVDRFATSGSYVSQTALPGGPILGLGANALDGVCELALDPAERLYANEWHQGVSRLLPSALAIEEGHESTGVAVDPASGEVYVDERTYVAVYEPSGAAVEVAGQPLRIGLGSLEDAYGLAVAGGRVYVPDAGSETVKVFEPAGDPATPVATLSHPFVSLVDAAVAVDPTNGHVVVADNSQPGYEHPQAALHEFDSTGAYLGQLDCGPVDGAPSGLAFDPAGNLYVTNGDSEGANVFKYGPYTASVVSKPSCAAVTAAGGRAALASLGGGGGAGASTPTAGTEALAGGSSASASSSGAPSVVQHGGVRVSFGSGIAPDRLPRHGATGIKLDLSAAFAAARGGDLPQLRRVAIGFNRAGKLHPGIVPSCTVAEIQPATTAAAREACGRSIVGSGTFSADVRLPRQSPFPAQGKVLVFNGRFKGHPAVLAHVYGTRPVPTSFTLPFTIGAGRGTFGTVLRAALPEATGNAAAITGLTLSLGRSVASRGHRRFYVTAGCPAPKGFRNASFPLVRGSFGFAGGLKATTTVVRTCRARG